LTAGAGIALNYVAGAGAIGISAVSTLISLAFWGTAGISTPLVFFFLLFGALPLGGGVWMLRQGAIRQKLLHVKLLKEMVRQHAFKYEGRMRPIDLAQAEQYSEQKALETLKNLAAEDPERIELQLDYDSGEIYFEFVDIRRALAARKEYAALPVSETLGRKAVEMAVMIGKTVETFYDYVEYAHKSVNDNRKTQKAEQYKEKVEHFLRELGDLKQQEGRGNK